MTRTFIHDAQLAEDQRLSSFREDPPTEQQGPASAPFGPGEGYVGTCYPLPREPYDALQDYEQTFRRDPYGAEPPRVRTSVTTRLLRWARWMLGGAQ
jgi:hypothetical protein